MTILIDPLFAQQSKNSRAYLVGKRNDHFWCHMVSTEGADAPELHEMALSIGLKRSWHQGDHYDLTPSRRDAAVKCGAVEVSRREIVLVRRAWRLVEGRQ